LPSPRGGRAKSGFLLASEIYTEDNRKMKTVGRSDEVCPASHSMSAPCMGDNGEIVTSNDLSRAKFDVVSDVGPSSSSKRSATVRAITGMLHMVADPADQKVLSAVALMNNGWRGSFGCAGVLPQASLCKWAL